MLRRLTQTDAPQRAYWQDEAYRVLRSNLSVVLAELERPTVLVTSAYPGEGKTATTVNLARSLALAGRRVILVDLDLRHPDVHRWVDTHNEYGVSDVLLERRSLSDSLQYIEVGRSMGRTPRALYILSTGTSVSNPAELLGTRRMAQLLDTLADQADVVLLDTPPVLPVADTLVIGRMVAGAILVVETRRTPVPAIQRAKDALIRNQTRLLGLVVNKMQTTDADFGYGYGYGYGYGSLPEDEAPDGNGGGASTR
jgi:capsular exopolysaccharide synthesis family protein